MYFLEKKLCLICSMLYASCYTRYSLVGVLIIRIPYHKCRAPSSDQSNPLPSQADRQGCRCSGLSPPPAPRLRCRSLKDLLSLYLVRIYENTIPTKNGVISYRKSSWYLTPLALISFTCMQVSLRFCILCSPMVTLRGNN